jgi:hypothetical protein
MSVGIAAAGARATGRREPVPLPVQALDHGTGHVLATAIGRAMSRLLRDGDVQEVRASLVGTAQLLFEHPTPDGLAVRPPDWSDADTEPVTTAWGPARRAPIPGAIDGVRARLDVAPGPLGRDPAAWGLPNG